jgi:cytosine/adenosine deaminase-related metal-dependent hydrolase
LEAFMAETTVIRKASWAITWDGDRRLHRYANDVDVAFSGGDIIHVGGRYQGVASREIDGQGLLVMPGLVNIHSHPCSEPMSKGIMDELGSPRLHNSALYEFMPLFRADLEGVRAAAQTAYCELLLSGVTSVIDISGAHDGWLDGLAQSGLRAWAAPMFRSGRWFTRNGFTVEYEWDEAGGRAAMEGALQVVDQAAAHPCGRLSGVISPGQVDTCTAQLLRAAHGAARDRGLPFQVHAAQSVVEFQEITRRHGVTPIQWLGGLGVLGPRTIIGHAIFLDHHPWLHWSSRRDLGLLAETGTTVAHCPTVFSRRGMMMVHLGAYLDGGVNVGMGTDTYPHNMLEEMRHAMIFARLAAGQVVAGTSQVFDAATLGGARALGREDIGRLAAGAKADLVLVDVRHPMMRPARDPLRSLVYCAAERAVRHVFVDGLQVVRDGTVLTMDYASAAQALEEAQARAMKDAPDLDYARRPMETLSPLTFPREP